MHGKTYTAKDEDTDPVSMQGLRSDLVELAIESSAVRKVQDSVLECYSEVQCNSGRTKGVGPIMRRANNITGSAAKSLTLHKESQIDGVLGKVAAKVRFADNGCIEWIGAKFSTGYGLQSFNGKLWKAHRYIWTLVNGPIPPGIQVLHRCDNRPCVNPEHLFLGTDKDNHQDKAAKGRHWQQKKTHCPRGHEYTFSNTYLRNGRHRVCRKCRHMLPAEESAFWAEQRRLAKIEDLNRGYK